LVAQVATKVLSLPIGIILARGIGASGKGSLSLIQLVATTSVVLFGLGMGPAFSYFAARGQLRGRDAVLASVLQAAAVSVLLLGVFVVSGEWIAQAILHTPDTHLLVIGVFGAAPALISGMLLSFVIGHGSVRRATEITLACLAGQLVAYIVFAMLGMLTLAVAVGIWATALVVEALAFAVTAWGMRTSIDVPVGVLPLFRRSWRFGLAVWAAGLLGFSALRVDMFLLGGMKNAAAVGVYSVAVTFAELLWFVPNALGNVLSPKVAAEQEGSWDLTLRLSRILWVFVLCAAVVVALVAIPTIPLLFGREFAAASLPLLFLIPGVVATAAANPVSAHLMGTGRPVFGAAAAAVNLTVNVVANLALIPVLGASGAALASTLSYSASAVVLLVVFKRLNSVPLRQMLVPTSDDLRQVTRGFANALKRN
jgi:O-antigen/teichoic acid export membrane protein